MEAKNFKKEFLLNMAHSQIGNYVIPGLSSSLIGKPSEHGTVRLFECSRDHQEGITPHSHRFDLMCWVLQGSVINRLWSKALMCERRTADCYKRSILRYRGGFGDYDIEESDEEYYLSRDYSYSEGECYSMKAESIHSIFFAKDTKVLFFEGPSKNDSSVILEPVVNGEKVPTFTVEDWMFRPVPKSRS